MTNKIRKEFVKSPNVQLKKLENKQISIDNEKVLNELFENDKLVTTLKKLALV